MKRLLKGFSHWAVWLVLGLSGFTFLTIQGELGMATALRLLSTDYGYFENPGAEPFDPLGRGIERSLDDVSAMSVRVQRMAAIEELAPLVVQSEQALMVGSSPFLDVSPEAARGAADLLMAERVTSEVVKVGVFTRDVNTGLPDDLAPSTVRRRDFIAGRLDGETFCLSIRPTTATQTWVAEYSSGDLVVDLGTCRLVSRYGLPGELVGQWYDRQGVNRSARRMMTSERWGDYDASLDARACQAGATSRCSRYWSADAGREDSGDDDLGFVVDQNGAADRGWGLQLDNRGLTMLEEQFGAERFLRFWTSDLGVEQAFEEAFGTPAHSWVKETLDAHHPLRRAGPAPQPVSVLLTLLLSTLGGLVGVSAVTRRSI